MQARGQALDEDEEQARARLEDGAREAAVEGQASVMRVRQELRHTKQAQQRVRSPRRAPAY